ncbi:MAG: hypothetical protein AAF605_04135 [Myxococcota bacterium]
MGSARVIAKPAVRTGFENQPSKIANRDERRFVFGGSDTVKQAWEKALELYDVDSRGNSLARGEKSEVVFAFWLVQVLGRQPEPGDEIRLPDTFDIMMSELRPATKESAALATELVGKDAITLTVNKKRRERMAKQARAQSVAPATAAAFAQPGAAFKSHGVGGSRVGSQRVKLNGNRVTIEPGVLLDQTLKEFAKSYSADKGDLVEQFKKLPTWPALRKRLPELLRSYPSRDAFYGDIDRLLEDLGRDGFWSKNSVALKKVMLEQFFVDAVGTPVRKRVLDLADRAAQGLALLDSDRVVKLLADQVGSGNQAEAVLLESFGIGDARSVARLADARHHGRSITAEIVALRDEHREAWKDLKRSALDVTGRMELFKTFPDLTRQELRRAGLGSVSTDGPSLFGSSDFGDAALEAARYSLLKHDRTNEGWLMLAGSVAASAATGGMSFVAALAITTGADLPSVLTAVAEADRAGLMRTVGLADEKQLKKTRSAVFATYVLGTAAAGRVGARLGDSIEALAKGSRIGKFLGVETLSELTTFDIDQLCAMVPPFLGGSKAKAQKRSGGGPIMAQRALIEASLKARGVDLNHLVCSKYGHLLDNDALRDAAITAFCSTYGMELVSMKASAIEQNLRSDLEQLKNIKNP